MTNKSNKTRIIGGVSVLAVAALSAVVVSAGFISNASALDQTWGPERETFTWDKPAPFRTFNSITNNPDMGDERNFVRVMEVGSGQKYKDNVDVVAGKEYEVYVYYHNNASASLNESGKGIADNVRIATSVPEKIKVGQSGIIKGTISSTNTTPKSVWDTAFLNVKDSTVYMRYVPNSATIHNAGTANGQILDKDALFSETGAKIAHYNDQWGMIPGCNEYAGYITYRLKADKPDFTNDKTVSVAGANDFKDEIATIPGQELEFKIVYKNTGTTIQKNVKVLDKLPEGVEYVPGSVFVKTPAKPAGESVSDSLFGTGLVIGDFNAGEEATITYKAKVKDDEKLFACGGSVVKNKSTIATSTGNEEDETNITINRNCMTSELPETGPVEIVLAISIVAGIGVGTWYLIHSRRALSKAKAGISGDDITLSMTDEPKDHVAEKDYVAEKFEAKDEEHDFGGEHEEKFSEEVEKNGDEVEEVEEVKEEDREEIKDEAQDKEAKADEYINPFEKKHDDGDNHSSSYHN